jgi:hypothetical protein
MRTVDADSHDERYPLGKPIREEAEQAEDDYEAFQGLHGPMKRNKRTGAVETCITPKGPQFPPNPWQAHIDSLRKQIAAQEADGFSINEFGVW